MSVLVVCRTRAELNAREIGVVFGQRSQLWWDLPVIESFLLNQAIYGIAGAVSRKPRAVERTARTRHLSRSRRATAQPGAADALRNGHGAAA